MDLRARHPDAVDTDAGSLHGRALTLVSAGRFAEARALLTTALRLADDLDVRADVVTTTAWVQGETGALDEAVAACEDALTWPGLTPTSRATVQARLAALLVRAGDGDRALALFDAAVDVLAERPAVRARALINRGYLFLARRELDAAAADLAEAEEAFARVGDDVEVAKVRHNRGYVALLTGDLVTALDLMDAARPVLRHLSVGHRAVCDLDRAVVLEAAGLSADALDVVSDVVASLHDSEEWHTLAEAELALARFVSESDPVRAVRLATHASDVFAQHGSPGSTWRAAAVAAHASTLLPADHGAERGPRPRPDLAALDDLADRLESQHAPAEGADLRIRAAQVALAGGDAEGARRRLARLAPATDLPLRSALLATVVEVDLDRRDGRSDRALDRAARAMDDFVAWQESFGSLSLQFATHQRVTDLVVQGLDAAWETGDPDEVFAWSERTRAVAARWSPLRAAADPTTQAALAELRDLADDVDATSARRREQLRAVVRERGLARHGAQPAGTPRREDTSALVPIADVERSLADAGACAVSFVWRGERLGALTIGAAGRRLHDLGDWSTVADVVTGLPADLDMAAARLDPGLAAAIHGSLADRLADLGTLLLHPLLAHLDRDRVLLTVPGVLAGVPWAMLPPLRGRSLSVPVSAGWWTRRRAAARVPTDRRRVGVVCGPGTTHGLREADAVARAWEGADHHVTSVSGDDATADAANLLAAGTDVLHVCAHGGHSTEHPLFSRIDLAGGPWFGHDVEGLPAVPDLVVMSACELGRSAGDLDALGMVRVWLQSGARCVVAAPANLSDEVAAELLPALHERLAEGHTPGDALAGLLDHELERRPAAEGPAVETAGLPALLCYGDAW